MNPFRSERRPRLRRWPAKSSGQSTHARALDGGGAGSPHAAPGSGRPATAPAARARADSVVDSGVMDSGVGNADSGMAQPGKPGPSAAMRASGRSAADARALGWKTTSGAAAAPAPTRPRPGFVEARHPIPETPDVTFYQRRGKRLLDIVLSGGALLALLPLFLVIIASIKLEDRGPVFYCSTRVGRGGRLFRFFKFRSMVMDADAVRADLEHMNECEGPIFKMQQDPRITRTGRFLRRTSMDELPQFWNVFVGDMSLVGPRPPLPAEVVQYEAWQLRRLSVVPGLTCLWQISGRSTIGFDEWMRLDMQYIESRCLRADLGILLRTIPAVVSGEGAY